MQGKTLDQESRPALNSHQFIIQSITIAIRFCSQQRLLVGTRSCNYYLNRSHFFIYEAESLRVCARFLKLSECEKVLTFRLHFVKNFRLQFCFPEDENSTHKTRRVTCDFHSPDRLDTRIGEWASVNFQPRNVLTG